MLTIGSLKEWKGGSSMYSRCKGWGKPLELDKLICECFPYLDECLVCTCTCSATGSESRIPDNITRLNTEARIPDNIICLNNAELIPDNITGFNNESYTRQYHSSNTDSRIKHNINHFNHESRIPEISLVLTMSQGYQTKSLV